MKAIDNINKFFYLITVGLYVSMIFIFYALYAQVALGIAQLTLALILLIQYNKLDKTTQNHLVMYWVFAIANLFLLYVANEYNIKLIQVNFWIFAFVTPMCIATYFTYITHSNRDKKWI